MDEMKKLFIDGIKLDNEVFDQQRIDQVKQIQKDRLFAFYPTVLVTTPIFKEMLK